MRAKNIVAEREKREFISIEDLQKRGKVSQTLIEKMKSMKIKMFTWTRVRFWRSIHKIACEYA